jgi:LPXTG-site transpeptidase (sortase) family protein
MYRQRQTRSGLLLPILLGIFMAGVFIYLNAPTPQTTPAAPADLATATPAPMLQAAAITATPQPRQRMSLVLPNAGVDAPIIDAFIRDGTWDVANLGANVGHLMGTAPLGTVGNHGLAGHSELRDGSRGIFAYIRELNYGDPVHVLIDDVTYAYRVSGVREVDPSDLSVLSASETDRLTLITCDDYDFLLDLYRVRVVVFAERVA